jgi:imidazoleglycerol-phosphate dehydratase
MNRTATKTRKTGETEVTVELAIGPGQSGFQTGVGFFDHMLELLSRHSGIALKVEATGDLETGSHHTVEDTGIVIGQALDEALGDRRGIRRYGSALIPMDESLAECAIDLSGRSAVVFRGEIPPGEIAGFETELTREFFEAVARESGMTLHIEIRYGENTHHRIEAVFKSFARALRAAVAIDPDEPGIPSTKGTLSS